MRACSPDRKERASALIPAAQAAVGRPPARQARPPKQCRLSRVESSGRLSSTSPIFRPSGSPDDDLDQFDCGTGMCFTDRGGPAARGPCRKTAGVTGRGLLRQLTQPARAPSRQRIGTLAAHARAANSATAVAASPAGQAWYVPRKLPDRRAKRHSLQNEASRVSVRRRRADTAELPRLFALA